MSAFDGDRLVLSADRLASLEDKCARKVAANPADHSARLSLAWCSYLMAWRRCGEAEALRGSHGQSADALGPADMLSDEVERLVRDSVRHTLTVQHISPSARERRVASALRDLQTLTVGEGLLAEIDRNSAAMLEQFAEDLLNSDF